MYTDHSQCNIQVYWKHQRTAVQEVLARIAQLRNKGSIVPCIQAFKRAAQSCGCPSDRIPVGYVVKEALPEVHKVID